MWGWFPMFPYPELPQAHRGEWLQSVLSVPWPTLEGCNHWWLWCSCILMQQEIFHFSDVRQHPWPLPTKDASSTLYSVSQPKMSSDSANCPLGSTVVAFQLLSHVQLFATRWTAACQASLSFIISWNLPKLMSIESVMLPNHLILCCPLITLLSIFPRLRVFSNELALHLRWSKYWSFNISPSNEYSGLISFMFDWFDLLALKSLLQYHSSKALVLWHLAFFMVQLSHPYMTTRKTITLTIWSFVGKVISLGSTENPPLRTTELGCIARFRTLDSQHAMNHWLKKGLLTIHQSQTSTFTGKKTGPEKGSFLPKFTQLAKQDLSPGCSSNSCWHILCPDSTCLSLWEKLKPRSRLSYSYSWQYLQRGTSLFRSDNWDHSLQWHFT